MIPYYRLTSDICHILCDNFENISVWRFTDGEFKNSSRWWSWVYENAVRLRRRTPEWLEQYAAYPDRIPALTELNSPRYALPANETEVKVFKGERFNQKELEQQLRRCDSFQQLMARSQLDSGVKHPLLPLSISQIGTDRRFRHDKRADQCDSPHIIKGRIVKVIHRETDERFAANR